MILKLKSYIQPTLINSWNNQAEQQQSRAGLVGRDTENKQVRDCEIRSVSFNDVPDLYLSISSVMLPVVDAHMSKFRVDINRTLEIQHSTYHVGNFYSRHTDIGNARSIWSMPTSRKISIVIMATDPTEYEGGDLVIEGETMPKDKGTVVMFVPMMWHEVKPVTGGIRKSIVAWVHGPTWR